LARRAKVSSAVVKSMVDAGVLKRVLLSEDPPFPEPDLSRAGKPLSETQALAGEELKAQIRNGGYCVSLLDGVTGSGKTEVYLEAAAQALAQAPDAQVLVLLPEIALTQAVLGRFEARFGATPVEWHSAITHKARCLA
jgi:primosomal protein N' (replication factor Y) (superfamily II helicase)